MIRDDVVSRSNQKRESCGQDFAFARDGRRQDAVEGRDAVGRDDQQVAVVNAVNVAHFAAAEQF